MNAFIRATAAQVRPATPVSVLAVVVTFGLVATAPRKPRHAARVNTPRFEVWRSALTTAVRVAAHVVARPCATVAALPVTGSKPPARRTAARAFVAVSYRRRRQGTYVSRRV